MNGLLSGKEQLEDLKFEIKLNKVDAWDG